MISPAVEKNPKQKVSACQVIFAMFSVYVVGGVTNQRKMLLAKSSSKFQMNKIVGVKQANETKKLTRQ